LLLHSQGILFLVLSTF